MEERSNTASALWMEEHSREMRIASEREKGKEHISPKAFRIRKIDLPMTLVM